MLRTQTCGEEMGVMLEWRLLKHNLVNYIENLN